MDAVDFASGTGGVVNNGSWISTAHEDAKRVANFDTIVDAFKVAGMGGASSDNTDSGDSTNTDSGDSTNTDSDTTNTDNDSNDETSTD